MPPITKNVWGAAGSGVDQQRSDLFYVLLRFPALLVGAQGVSQWEQEVAFAVEQFPFPDRSREMTAIKYLNQTNHMLGADTASGSITMPIRYAFNRRAAELLERWHWLTSNPVTGSVAMTSVVKSDGYFYWLVPNMAKIANVEDLSSNDVYSYGAKYRLEGVLVENLKPSDDNMTDTGGVTLSFTIKIDRYYPEKVTDLNPANFLAAVNRGVNTLR